MNDCGGDLNREKTLLRIKIAWIQGWKIGEKILWRDSDLARSKTENFLLESSEVVDGERRSPASFTTFGFLGLWKDHWSVVAGVSWKLSIH